MHTQWPHTEVTHKYKAWAWTHTKAVAQAMSLDTEETRALLILPCHSLSTTRCILAARRLQRPEGLISAVLPSAARAESAATCSHHAGRQCGRALDRTWQRGCQHGLWKKTEERGKDGQSVRKVQSSGYQREHKHNKERKIQASVRQLQLGRKRRVQKKKRESVSRMELGGQARKNKGKQTQNNKKKERSVEKVQVNRNKGKRRNISASVRKVQPGMSRHTAILKRTKARKPRCRSGRSDANETKTQLAKELHTAEKSIICQTSVMNCNKRLWPSAMNTNTPSA